MEQLLQLMLEVRVLRLLQLLAVTALVLLLATEPELLLMPVVIKVQMLVRQAIRAPRRALMERRVRRTMARAVKELQLVQEEMRAALLAEMPGLVLLPQTVEQLARLEPAPLPFPMDRTRTPSSIGSRRR
jgi:hypothetical protein